MKGRWLLRIEVNSFTFLALGVGFAIAYKMVPTLLDGWLGLPFEVSVLESVEGGAAFSLVSWGVYTLLSNLLG